MLGASSTAASGVTTTLALTRGAASGALVIVQVGAQGHTPITVSDSKGNAWSTAIELDNTPNTAAAGIYYSTLTKALAAGDAITATVGGGANANTRAIAAVVADGVTAPDQIGGARATGTTTPNASTKGAVIASAELVLGVTATGWMNADTFAPSSGFTQLYQYGTPDSSGCFDYEVSTTLSGVQTYGTTTTQAMASYAIVIATFK
jgi:hypothetical protein